MVIYSRFRDASGKELCGGNLIDDIVYDPLPPTLNVRVVQLGTQALQTESTLAANTLTLQLVALDQQGGSGVADMQISTDKTFANAAW